MQLYTTPIKRRNIVKIYYSIILPLLLLGFACDGMCQSMDQIPEPARPQSLPVISNHPRLYRFPSFEYGRITLFTGFSPDEQLLFNYNYNSGQMEIINTKGDTVEVKQVKELKFITIADHLFFHSYKIGYLEILHKSTVSLGVRNLTVVAYKTDAAPKGARGEVSKPYYTKHSSYYFLDKDYKPLNATPSAIKKLFYDQKKQVKAYLDQNQIDFENADQLVSLLVYCESLNGTD